jgi:hypothetical protein
MVSRKNLLLLLFYLTAQGLHIYDTRWCGITNEDFFVTQDKKNKKTALWGTH